MAGYLTVCRYFLRVVSCIRLYTAAALRRCMGAEDSDGVVDVAQEPGSGGSAIQVSRECMLWGSEIRKSLF